MGIQDSLNENTLLSSPDAGGEPPCENTEQRSCPLRMITWGIANGYSYRGHEV